MKIIGRICVFLLVAYMMVQGVSAQAAAPAITVSNETAAPGETVSVAISLENNPGIASAKLQVEFDTQILTLESVQDAGNLGTQVHKPELVSPYILTWANDTVTENFTYNGTIVTLVFRVAENAPEGETPITVSYDYNNYDIIDWEMNKVAFSVVDGSVKVGEAAPTDIGLFEYTLSGTEMTITGYTGEDAKVVIGSAYTIDGTEYTVTAIGEEAFAENTLIERITIPGSVAEIGDYAFYLCENLSSVKLSDGLQAIGADAFDGCAALTEIVIPKTVELIDEYAFYDCTALTTVTVLGKETEIGDLSLGYYYISRREDGLVEGFTVSGHAGSTAQSYAEAEGVDFEVLLRFTGASISLQQNLAVNYKVDKALFDTLGFEAPYVIVEFNDKQTKITSYTISDDRYVFSFRNIAPNQINDTLTATLYATFDGADYSSEPKVYSVSEYCYSMLGEYTDGQYAELRTLLVDLLNYGAASQVYTGYKTDALVNASLTDTQLQWGTSGDPVLESVLNTTYKTVEAPAAVWKGGSLYLQDTVAMRFKFTAEDADGLSVIIESGGKAWTLSSDQFVEENGVYFVYFAGLNAGQMRQNVFLTVYDGETAVSNTVCYSIESYAYEKQNSTISGLSELVKAMMKYGDSAYAYVN